MEYLLIITLQLLGIGFHVMQKVIDIDKLLPDDSLAEVFAKFWKTDRVTVIISGLVLALCLVVHYVVEVYWPTVTQSIYYGVPYAIWTFGLALVLGYSGQFFIYKLFGKLEKISSDKIDNINP